ncbi:YncE family protein [Algimonas porphyrae]|uniref:YncE family protein n=1 Tax=Algimonas porphyrae TaxID=1128113 RepID=A0ABQ5UY08_9PROT|nr:YncE family protein [Algimonas porphyrae]GLQ19737.1 hypothetical protein GCM10007854_06920 [Algimonas porphyrae]
MKTIWIAAIALLTACSSAATSADTPPIYDGPMLIVGNKGEDTVSFINLDDGTELARRDTSADAPHEIALSPDLSRAAVVNYGDRLIDIFDLETLTIIDTIDLGDNSRPHGIKWLADGRIIATTEGGQSLVDISRSGEVVGIRTDEDGTHMVAVSPDGSRAYTANLGAGTISLIDLDADRLIRTVPAGAGTEGIDLTPDGGELWVSNRSADSVIVYDAANLDELARLDVGGFPLRLVISPDGRDAVTSNLTDGSLSVIDVASRTLTRTIPVSGNAAAQQVTILFSADGSRLYVAETGTDTVAEVEFDTGTVLRRIPVGRQGDGLAIRD